MDKLIIAIDGPAGSGKSTIGKMLADRLGYVHLSTGAIYRAIGWKAHVEGVAYNDIPAMRHIIATTDLQFRRSANGADTIYMDGRDVTADLSSNEAGLMASKVSAIPEVRQGLLSLQRHAGQDGGVVLDGRDIGTVVFPDADVKFYLDASPEARARRRFQQLKRQGQAADVTQLLADITQRDHDDMTREVAPLRQADDAVYVDSTALSLENVVATMMTTVRKIAETH